MKILFSSYAYAPSLGGIESVSALLAREFVAAGHEVTLVTEVPALSDQPRAEFPVLRRPTFAELRQSLRWCDVVFQNNISLRHLIPALLARKPVLLVHQTWMRNTGGGIGWNDRLKRLLVPRVKNVAISEAIARDFDAPAEVIGNPYDDSVYKSLDRIPRDRDIIFVGRLVSDKGADLLLRALALLPAKASLTIVGSGPEEQKLRTLAGDANLDVTFAGAKSGSDLAEILNRHRLIAVPSRWSEPFGIVALEGIACGCVAIGSTNGGLPEAIGPCGLTFKNGDADQLAHCLHELITHENSRDEMLAAAPAHLQKFRAQVVAGRYLELLHQLARA